MKIHYLGTAAAEGWPAVFCQCEPCRLARKKGGKNIRTRSSLLIGDDVLVDLPPDTYLHALRAGLELGKIRHLLLTHSHGDHFYWPELFQRAEPYAHLEPGQTLHIWGNEKVGGILREEADKFGPCQIHTVRPGDAFQAGKLSVTALRADHAKGEDALLYLISDGADRIFHAHDSGLYPEETWRALAGKKLNLVNFDCTFGPISSRTWHMGIPEVLEAKAKLEAIGALGAGAKCVITHFSHNGGLLHSQLEELTESAGLIVAYDGMSIEI